MTVLLPSISKGGCLSWISKNGCFSLVGNRMRDDRFLRTLAGVRTFGGLGEDGVGVLGDKRRVERGAWRKVEVVIL